jgi:hypothetical protein
MRFVSRLAPVVVLLSAALAACGGSTPASPASAACAPAPAPALAEGSTPQEKRALGRIRAQLDKLGEEQAALCQAEAAGGSEAAKVPAKKAALEEKRASLLALAKDLDGAGTPGSRKRALDKLYRTAVPVDQRVEEISFRFGARAELPGESQEIDVAPGASLPTNTRVRFRVEVSQRAHVYIFQRSPSDEITVLFPEARIGTKNPLEPGAPQDIPGGSQRFRLNEKDVGMENVFLVVSRAPLPSLDAALARVKDGSVTKVAQNDLLRSLATVTPGTPPAGCGTRALELDGATSATSGAETCRRSRGLVLDGPADSAAPRGRDMEVRTDAGDDLIVKVFPFRHTARVPVQNDMVERADDEAGSAPPTGLPAEGDGGSHGRGTVGGPGGGKAPGVPVSRGIVMED